MMESYVGQIKPFPYGFEPRDWALCDGRLLQIAQNQALFALLGIRFGGDGTSNFALPDLRGAEPDSFANGRCHYYIALKGNWPPRS